MADAWTDDEIAAVLDGYFSLLDDPTQSKAAVYREVSQRIPRRNVGAVERKMQNVSSVLAEMGLTYVSGLKPAANRQAVLWGHVERRVRQRSPGSVQSPAPAEVASSRVLVSTYRPGALAAMPTTPARFTVDTDPGIQARGAQAHSDVQDRFAEALRQRGFVPLSPTGAPDFDVAWAEADGAYAIAEVKSLTDGNEESQVRGAIGQLSDYAAQFEAHGERVATLLIVLERQPSALPRWQAAAARAGIRLTWAPDFTF